MPTPQNGRDLPRAEPTTLAHDHWLDLDDATVGTRLERGGVPPELAVELLGRRLLSLDGRHGDPRPVHAIGQPLDGADLIVHGDDYQLRGSA